MRTSFPLVASRAATYAVLDMSSHAWIDDTFSSWMVSGVILSSLTASSWYIRAMLVPERTRSRTATSENGICPDLDPHKVFLPMPAAFIGRANCRAA